MCVTRFCYFHRKEYLTLRGLFSSCCMDFRRRSVMCYGSPTIVAVTRTRVLSLILCSGQQLRWGPTFNPKLYPAAFRSPLDHPFTCWSRARVLRKLRIIFNILYREARRKHKADYRRRFTSRTLHQ